MLSPLQWCWLLAHQPRRLHARVVQRSSLKHHSALTTKLNARFRLSSNSGGNLWRLLEVPSLALFRESQTKEGARVRRDMIVERFGNVPENATAPQLYI